jgi:hypothetical protein
MVISVAQRVLFQSAGISNCCTYLDVTRFLPGALGLFLRGELSFDSCTNLSTSALGTAMSFCMTLLKCWNSEVESKEGADFIPPFYAVSFSRVPAVALGGTHR